MKRTSLPLQRREFITLLGGAAAWPIAAQAQQPAMPVIGFLRSARPRLEIAGGRAGGLERGRLRRGPQRRDRISLGKEQLDRLPVLVAELIRRRWP